MARLVNYYELKQRILEERDKIPKTLPAAPYEFGIKKPNHHGNSMRGGIRKALRCLEQCQTVMVPSWIPVSERLPEPETDVLTFSGGCIDIITYRYNRRGLACFMFRDDCGYWKETFGKITHWMPLPEPPKEE